MKKIFLALAAVAALASCVDEKNIAPEQTGDNLVTITALATKTTLDGTSVVWENGDVIKVVLSGGEAQDFEALSVEGSTATFQGKFENPVTAQTAYAVYPSTAVSPSGISHTLPAEQTGTVTTGMNLSYAELDVDDLVAGSTEAVFSNALTLVKVVVPGGVKSVSLTSSSAALVGTAGFSEPSSGVMSINSVPTGHTVSISNAEGLPANNDILVFPGNAGELTLEMVGLNGAVYTKTVSDITFVASEYRTIDLTKVFKIDVAATLAVNPIGGKVTVPVAATAQYTYTVEENADWISVETSTYVQTKAFVGTNIVFNVEENTTGATRNANVTITWNDGEDQSKSFVITQENAYLDFVYVDPADPASGLIQWEETFGVYADADNAAAGTNAQATYKNVFTIDLSDDYSKGTYKINNMFVYNHAINGLSGGIYYADYVDGKLIVKDNDQSQYYFDGDITLVYDSMNKSFAVSNPLYFGKNTLSVDFPNKTGYIGGYTAAIKVDDPGAGGGGESPLNGTWNQTVVGMSWPSPSATMTIAVSGTTVTLTDFVAAGTVAVGTLDGDTITIPAGTNIGTGSNTAGPLSSDVILTVVGNTISTEPFNIAGWINVSSYSANKQ